MQKDIRLPNLIQRAFEAFHQVMGQFADKSDRIGQKKRRCIEYDLARRGIEGGKQFVLGEDLALAQKGHQGRLTYIGIAHERYTNEFTPVLSLRKSLLVNFLQTLTQQRD